MTCLCTGTATTSIYTLSLHDALPISTKIATTSYVDTLDAASDLDFSGDSGTGDVNLNTQTFAITGTANQIESTASGQGLSLQFPSAGVTLPNGSVATTQASSDDSTKVATTAYVKGLNNASDLDFTTDSGSGAVVLNSQTLSVLGTTNEIETSGSGQAVTIGLPSTINVNVTGNLTGNVTGNVTGDLTGNADTATKWQTARDLSLTGQATGTISSVDGSGNVSGAVTLDNNSVTAKVLTGLTSPSSSSVLATDTILEGFGKVQSQINGLAGGLRFMGDWNADTNSPVLSSGGGEAANGTTTATTANKLVDSSASFTSTVTVGDQVVNQVDGQTALVTNVDSDTTLSLSADIMVTGEAYTIDNSPFITQGHYYVVSVGGTTSLNGISNWSVGDWVIAGANNQWTKLDHSQVDGTGTAGNLTKWASTSVIADSIVSESGTAITVDGSLATNSFLSSTGNFSVNTDKFTVAASSGDTAFTGDFAINTDKFTVNATSGNTAIAGDVSMAKLTATKSGTAAVFNSGTTNVVASFTSTDGTGVIQLADSGGNVEIGAAGNDFVVQPAGGVTQLTVGSSSSTFAGDVIQSGASKSLKYWRRLWTDANNDWGLNNNAGSSVISVSGMGTPSTSSTTFAGNLGIGGSPSHPLDVKGADTNNATIARFYSNTGTRGSFVINNGTGVSPTAFIGTAGGSEQLSIGTNSTEAIRIDGSQNVGIGTDSPDQTGYGYKTLTVMGGTGAGDSGVLELLAPSVNADDQNYGIVSFGAGGTRTAMISANRKAANNAANLRFWTAPGGAGIEERMRILSNGRVSIGSDTTIAAANNLTLTNASAAEMDINCTGGHNYRLESNSSDNFVITDKTAAAERMRIDSSGNVSIGTVTPLYLVGTSDVAQISVNRVGTTGAITNTSRSAAYINLNGADGGSSIEFNTASGNNTQPTERMRITSSGEVCVGNTNVTGFNETFNVTGNGIATENTNGGNRGIFGFFGGTPLLIGTGDGVDVAFRTDNTEKMRIASSGEIIFGNSGTNNAGFLDFDGTSVQINTQRNPNTGAFVDSAKSNGSINIVGADGGSYIRFNTAAANNTAATERMRITSGGDINQNFDSSIAGSTQYGYTLAKQSGYSQIYLRTNSDQALFVQRFYNTNSGTLQNVGNIMLSGTSTAFQTSSDYRLKEDLQDFKGLDMVSKIPVYDFKWKSDESRSYGVMAHELQEVLPQAVSGEKDAEEMQGVDYSKIVPLLVKSIQELKAEVDKLKQECKCK